ncbi:MAG: hypothetical protein H7X79_02480 [Sporomusaceae bacterium]|nr:hypothetical protein [Sporomusaceae bacterium]
MPVEIVLLIGIFIGVFIGAFVVSLCLIAGNANTYNETFRQERAYVSAQKKANINNIISLG